MSLEHRGIFYGVLAALANSLIAVLIKVSVAAPNETMVFSRFFIGWLVLLVFYVRGKIKITSTHFSKHVARAFISLLSLYLYYFAIERLPLADAISLANTMPLFTPFIILIWLRLLVSKWRFMAAAIGFFGVLLMLNPGQFSFELASFAALGTGLCAAIAFTGIRQLSKVESTGAILFYYFTLATIISFFPCIYTWEPILEGKLWLYLFLMAILGVLFQYLLTLAFSMAPASKAGLTVYLAVVFGGIWGWFLWDEIPGLWNTIGMILTIGGGALAVLDKTEPKKL